jgi:eukaryotic-like serine/threonine-protein kinase
MVDPISSLQAALAGRYRIEHEIGRGGMGTIYLAHDLKHDRRVAVKVLRPELAASIGADRFLREIRIAAGLNHPHILSLHDSGAAGEHLYYVMPLIDGESLRQRLDREPQLPIVGAVNLVRQVASALAYAHGRGIVHRDIKPDNILLYDDEAVVADFGIARAIAAAEGEQITQSGTMVGTPAYMSPEQWGAGGTVDGRSDVYSLGCVLYEVLAGHPPFLGSTAQEVLARHAMDEVPSITAARKAVPPWLARVLERSLAKAPADRYATATEFAEALRGPPEHPPGPDAPAHGRRVRAGMAVGAVLVLLGLVATWRVLRPRARSGGPAPRSLAVLYFDNGSSDTADAYVANGLTEEIILRLGRLSRLTVKSRYAVGQYRHTPVTDPAALGRALEVEALVHGTVRRFGHRLRVSAELIRAATGVREWGSEYDRSDADLLDLEGELARAIATAVAGHIDPQDQARVLREPTTSPEAYDHFLRGDYFLAQRTRSATAAAIGQYEAALGSDSTFARAWARTAVCYALVLGLQWSYPGLGPDSLLARGVRAANTALALDSTSSDTWMALGMFDWFLHPATWAEAVAALERAVTLEPTNAEAQNMLGVSLFYTGEDSVAALALHRALALDPLRPISLVRLGEIAWFAGRRDTARRYVDSALAVAPGFVLAYLARAKMRLHENDPAGAKEDVETVFRIASEERSAPDPVPYGVLAAAHAASGDTVQARAVARELEVSLGTIDGLRPNAAAYLALAELAAGKRDRALHVLEQAAPRGFLLWWDLRWPEFDPLRTDPRFRRVVSGAPGRFRP